MYEFMCDRIIPGCTHKERGDTPEAVREKAIKHLHEGHGMEYIDEDLMAKVNEKAILLLPSSQ